MVIYVYFESLSILVDHILILTLLDATLDVFGIGEIR